MRIAPPHDRKHGWRRKREDGTPRRAVFRSIGAFLTEVRLARSLEDSTPFGASVASGLLFSGRSLLLCLIHGAFLYDFGQTSTLGQGRQLKGRESHATACSIPTGCVGGQVPVADHSKIAALVVKDETLLRPDIVDTLSSAGCEVLRATDADEALGYLRSGRRIDVIIIDIDLGGGFTGWGAAKTFRSARSDIPVIYTSSAETWHRMLATIDWLQEKPTDGDVVH